MSAMTNGDFQLPAQFDHLAVFAWALSGAVIGLRKRFDVIGVFMTALLSAIGGGVIRDGLLLQRTPAVLTDALYLPLILAATIVVIFLRTRIERARLVARLVTIIDAIGTPALAVVGLQLGLRAHLPIPGVMLIGCVSGVGGGVLRDVVVGDVPEIFKPGHFLAIPVAVFCGAFLLLTLVLKTPPVTTAWATVAGFFVVRVLTIRYDWRTRAILPDEAPA
jgi:uncharacterized membrane protein YeiH